jgi:hypothetical protein
MKLYNIRLANQPKTAGVNPQTANNTDAGTAFIARLMHPLVHQPPLGSQAVFIPRLLQVNQRALPRAKQPMLQSREWQIVRFGIHRSYRRF